MLAVSASLPVYLGYVAYLAGEEEQNLHATLFVTRLVDEFVQQRGRWPRSWGELEMLPFPSDVPRSVDRDGYSIIIGGATGFDWPRQSKELQRRVLIDFNATPEEIVAAEIVRFHPIRPNGSGFEYWKYGFVEHLQESVRATLMTTPSADHPLVPL